MAADEVKAGEGDAKKVVKVSKMNLEEVKEAIEKTQKNMGGLHSRHGIALQAQKKKLTEK